jgi:hypothetical protein
MLLAWVCPWRFASDQWLISRSGGFFLSVGSQRGSKEKCDADHEEIEDIAFIHP